MTSTSSQPLALVTPISDHRELLATTEVSEIALGFQLCPRNLKKGVKHENWEVMFSIEGYQMKLWTKIIVLIKWIVWYFSKWNFTKTFGQNKLWPSSNGQRPSLPCYEHHNTTTMWWKIQTSPVSGPRLRYAEWEWDRGTMGVGFSRSFVRNSFRIRNILQIVLVLVASIYDTVSIKSSIGLTLWLMRGRFVIWKSIYYLQAIFIFASPESPYQFAIDP